MILPFEYERDAKKVMEWGKKHSFPFPDAPLLPDTGLIVDEAAVGFLYRTNSKLGWIEWVFSNPEKTKEERSEALDTLMKALEKMALIYGIRVLFSASAGEYYQKVLDRNGFTQTDQYMVHHVKRIEV